MAKITLEEQPDFAVFPAETILDLKIESADIKEVDGQNGKWQKVDCKFKILGIQATGDGSPKENYESMITQNIFGSVPFRLTDSPENKLRIWSEAIFRMELGVGFELDTDLFVGRTVRGITSTYNKRGANNPATGQPFKRHQVETLLPAAGAPVSSVAPTQGASQAPAAVAPVADPWAAAAPAAAPSDPWATPAGGFGDDEPPF